MRREVFYYHSEGRRSARGADGLAAENQVVFLRNFDNNEPRRKAREATG